MLSVLQLSDKAKIYNFIAFFTLTIILQYLYIRNYLLKKILYNVIIYDHFNDIVHLYGYPEYECPYDMAEEKASLLGAVKKPKCRCYDTEMNCENLSFQEIPDMSQEPMNKL
jgi:hypothetical protein